jgi:hypothetical protein
LRRFIDNGVRAPTVYKLPPAFMTSGDENANSQQRLRRYGIEEQWLLILISVDLSSGNLDRWSFEASDFGQLVDS